MKNIFYILAVIILIAGAAVISCNIDNDKTIENAKQDLRYAKNEFDKEWKQFKINAESRVRSNEKSIDDFKTEIKAASVKIKAKYEKEVAELEQKNIRLKKKIREYRNIGKSEWEEFKRSFNNDMDEFSKSLENLFVKRN